jgi:hypothetical protein
VSQVMLTERAAASRSSDSQRYSGRATVGQRHQPATMVIHLDSSWLRRVLPGTCRPARRCMIFNPEGSKGSAPRVPLETMLTAPTTSRWAISPQVAQNLRPLGLDTLARQFGQVELVPVRRPLPPRFRPGRPGPERAETACPGRQLFTAGFSRFPASALGSPLGSPTTKVPIRAATAKSITARAPSWLAWATWRRWRPSSFFVRAR